MVKIFAVGASRNIGYHTALNLLRKGDTVIFFVRNPTALENDPEVQAFLESKLAKLIRGDALNEADIASAWKEATADGVSVDYVLFSVGGLPKVSLTKGFVMEPPNLCTQCLFNTLAAISKAKATPRLVAVSSQGITTEEHRHLPIPLRMIYALMKVPHIDKHGMEQLTAYCDGKQWTETDHTGTLLPETWKQTLGDEGWLKSVVVLRPALLTDGAEKGKYRVLETPNGTYTISRRDVAHFIVESLMPNWDEFQGKALVLGY